MTDKDEGQQAGPGNAEVIEGFYDWGPGVVVTADCLGQSYQTQLADRHLIVRVPAFDGTGIAEPPLRYKRPDSYIDVDPPNPWGPHVIGHNTDPKAINNAGVVVGTSHADHGGHAVMWRRP
jgi:hypothetical protein